jgi:hypothetical protein
MWLSAPWDKGTLSTKPKQLYRGPSRTGSRVWLRTHTSTSYEFCQVGTVVGHAQSSRDRSGPDWTWVRARYVATSLHQKPTKSVAQVASEPTPDEGSYPAESPQV